ncbi:MAG TPA: transglutaminase-like cysteine peptidase [Xanthobacteraceae bacterium]|nr:transglutaminase-like cysteine peptidase [Xanthobacteraceae bacterium]
MFGRVAARSFAFLPVVLAAVLGSPAAALAQYQIGISAPAIDVPTLAAAEPFGRDVLPVFDGEVLAKWNGLTTDIRNESDVLTRCHEDAQSCPGAARKFLAVIADGRAHDGRARFGIINRAINLAIEPMSDQAQWGVPDRWSAPLATLATGRGDCEDYAIAKYVALKEAGVSENDLRLVIVRDLGSGQDHAVVTARLDTKWIVLDNRRLVLLEDLDMPRVLPLFALGHDGVKAFVSSPMVAAGAPVTTASAAEPSSLGF